MAYILTGLLCNGKTTMLRPLGDLIQNKINKKVVTIEEFIPTVLDSISKFEIDFKTFKERQSIFFAVAKIRQKIINQTENTNKNIIYLCDRGILDVVAYSLLEGENILNMNHIQNEIVNDCYYFIKLPKDNKIIEKCMRKKERNRTVGHWENLRKREEKFKNLIQKYYPALKTYEHPADDPETMYKIAETIIKNERS